MYKIIYNANHRLRPFWRLLLFLLITFAINIPLQIGLQKIMNQSLTRGVFSAAIYLASVITSLYIQIKFLDKSSFKKYGLQMNSSWWKEFFIGLCIALVQLSIFFLILYYTDNVKVIAFFSSNSSNYSFTEGLLSEIFGLLVGSSAEEIFFRGFLFYIVFEALQTFQKNPSKRAITILIVIAPLFGIAHVANNGATILSVINLALDAMMMCLPFLITGQLGMSIGMHFSWNFIQGVLLGFATSGNPSKVNFLTTEISNNLLTGGSFGPEGSILFIGLDAIALLCILYWKKYTYPNNFVHPSIIEHITPINKRSI